jgi:predicted ArsR family transcriptional regulator
MNKPSRRKAQHRPTPTSDRKTLAVKSSPEFHRWTFLTNHAHVLILLYRNPELVLREVALQVGITERAVQRIIHDLEEGGFIEREKIGRRNRYRVLEDCALRHPIEAHRSIGELLRLMSETGNAS